MTSTARICVAALLVPFCLASTAHGQTTTYQVVKAFEGPYMVKNARPTSGLPQHQAKVPIMLPDAEAVIDKRERLTIGRPTERVNRLTYGVTPQGSSSPLLEDANMHPILGLMLLQTIWPVGVSRGGECLVRPDKQ